MDVLFKDAAGPIPQDDDDDDDDDDADERQRLRPERTSISSETGTSAADGTERQRTLRRSISSHPRFMSEEERIARAAAAKVAAEEKRKSRPPGWASRLFGAGSGSSAGAPSARGRTDYQAVESEEQ